MRINNVHLNGLVIGQVREPEEKDAARTAEADAVSRETSQHTPSPELTRLITLVQDEAEVRPDAVERAAARLDSGEYLTHESAVATAQALLEARE